MSVPDLCCNKGHRCLESQKSLSEQHVSMTVEKLKACKYFGLGNKAVLLPRFFEITDSLTQTKNLLSVSIRVNKILIFELKYGQIPKLFIAEASLYLLYKIHSCQSTKL
jgi:hypothetical protein